MREALHKDLGQMGVPYVLSPKLSAITADIFIHGPEEGVLIKLARAYGSDERPPAGYGPDQIVAQLYEQELLKSDQYWVKHIARPRQ
jgi:hypothetical protein